MQILHVMEAEMGMSKPARRDWVIRILDIYRRFKCFIKESAGVFPGHNISIFEPPKQQVVGHMVIRSGK